MEAPQTFRATVDCYLPRLRPHQRFVGRSAVRLWALPFPYPWQRGEALEIAAPQEQSPPRAAGVKGRHLRGSRAQTWYLRRAPVVDPIAAVLSSARELTVDQLVILLDAILTDCTNYPGMEEVARPRCTPSELQARIEEWGRFPGSGRVRAALRMTRENVESPKETETRLAILEAGIPEPAVQFAVREGDRFIARVDLAYPQWRIAIEYEGDGHRRSKEQWRRDVARQRDLEDRGWILIRLTQQDLEDPREFLARLRRAIASRAS